MNWNGPESGLGSWPGWQPAVKLAAKQNCVHTIPRRKILEGARQLKTKSPTLLHKAYWPCPFGDQKSSLFIRQPMYLYRKRYWWNYYCRGSYHRYPRDKMRSTMCRFRPLREVAIRNGTNWKERLDCTQGTKCYNIESSLPLCSCQATSKRSYPAMEAPNASSSHAPPDTSPAFTDSVVGKCVVERSYILPHSAATRRCKRLHLTSKCWCQQAFYISLF